MSVISEKSFEYNPPSWVNDPSVPAGEKKFLIEEMGMGDDMADIEFVLLDSRCFLCSEVLQLPYVYWHGSDGKSVGEAKGISLHAKCARHLAKSIIRDADECEGMCGG